MEPVSIAACEATQGSQPSFSRKQKKVPQAPTLLRQGVSCGLFHRHRGDALQPATEWSAKAFRLALASSQLACMRLHRLCCRTFSACWFCSDVEPIFHSRAR